MYALCYRFPERFLTVHRSYVGFGEADSRAPSEIAVDTFVFC
jgi:hypothetical protein